ncbi:glycosyltransferase [Shewanella xiamenensis]|uniref:glycosyltransferase n=1 Tax=Shewanella xiamenensis TaxID=332186 RepID=UPI000D646358|nr:glycosyltransferase [Shewanella xiamenensis]MCT8858009.1 glycosyltransferase [Shewanella xiamenensis]PWH04408.1 hypothetical protein DIY08_03385 [Shewanella xiamenensis]UWG63469.1 glycosyltransferase [Shewanella xiamenensis]
MIELSVITVNFNSGSGLENTVNSLDLLKQNALVEHILIDACSSDESSFYIKNNTSVFDVLLIEPDDGIYDAMNKAVRISSGKWIWFVNSGDEIIVDSLGLIDFLNSLNNENCIVYSDLKLSTGDVISQHPSVKFFIRRMLNHQNVIYSRDLLMTPYDVNFKYCADFAHLIPICHVVNFVKYDDFLCLYDLDGMTGSRNFFVRASIWSERAEVMKSANGFFLRSFGYIFCKCVSYKFSLHGFIKGFIK